ncbi:hypothetical protein HHFLNI_HHFLNI_03395, partial [Dysosmobacter welbionis]
LHNHLRADGAAALGRVFGPGELAAQGLPYCRDHIVHDQDGGQLPPGGVRCAAGCGPGGDPPHRGYCARRALQGRHAAPHQQVDVIVGVCGAQAPQPPDLRPVER